MEKSKPGDILDSNSHSIEVTLQGKKYVCMFDNFQNNVRDITLF